MTVLNGNGTRKLVPLSILDSYTTPFCSRQWTIARIQKRTSVS
jgi:hypothetical protein